MCKQPPAPPCIHGLSALSGVLIIRIIVVGGLQLGAHNRKLVGSFVTHASRPTSFVAGGVCEYKDDIWSRRTFGA